MGDVVIQAPIVRKVGNRAVTSSKDVADYFGKAHKHVLDDIRSLISQEPSIEPNFRPNVILTKVGYGVRKDPSYDMTRDGFTLLAMGFTGAKALKFKLAYIAEFNAMEEALKASTEIAQRNGPPFRSPESSARVNSSHQATTLHGKRRVASAPSAKHLRGALFI